MSHLSDKIIQQLDMLREYFKQHIDSDYVYIDVPLYHNIGDWLIAMGAWELLKEISYKCLAKLRWDDYYSYTITPDTIIILQGGGNFGDLYRGATTARNEVIRQYPNNKIIILSQTITYLSNDLLDQDAALYSQHRNLHICASDNESYQLAKKHFHANNVYLLPDTAIGLYTSLPKYDGKTIGKTLIINRLDKEADGLFNEKGDVKEWESILRDIHFNRVWYPYRILHKIKKMLHSKVLLECERIYTCLCLYPFVQKRIPQYYLHYDKVLTTRLHGYLLALLLHLPVEIKDNKYHKITNYITTWMI